MRSRVARQLQHILDVAHTIRLSHTTAATAAAFAKDAPSSAGVEIPDGFSPHDYAVVLLHVAAEVEHGLLTGIGMHRVSSSHPLRQDEPSSEYDNAGS
jgi:hypothetical protein